MKKVISISMVRNEADIIESFVRYHLNIFDRMVILDNFSTDNTLQILKNLESEGLPIDIVIDDNLEYLQAQKTTSLMQSTFHNYEPDIIFPLDADEFLISINNLDHPRKYIEQMEMDTVYHLKWVNYISSIYDKSKDLFIPKRITYSTINHDLYPFNYLNNVTKVAVSKQIMENYSPSLTQGNHHLYFNHQYENIKILHSKELGLAHFMIRSLDHWKSKVVVGFLNYLSRKNKHLPIWHWEDWFQKIKLNPHLNLNDAFDNPVLVDMPINLEFCQSLDIKYTTPHEVDFVKNLLLYSEMLAIKYSEIKKD